MALKDERYVCTLADCGTIREASEKLFISSPALSMYIRNLEAELGVDLFYRSRQRFYPTEIGEKYIARCRKILEIDRDFTAELERRRHRRRNCIAIGMYKRCAAYLWLPLRESLKTVFPTMELRLTVDKPNRLRELLNMGELDFILLSVPAEPTFQQFPVGEDELLLACPASWNLPCVPLGGGRYPLAELSNIPEQNVFLPGETQSIYAFVVRYLKEKGIDYSRFSTLNNMEISMRNVSAGIGCCFTLRSYLTTFPDLPNLSFYSLSPESVRVQWYLECLDAAMNTKYFTVIKEKIAENLSRC